MTRSRRHRLLALFAAACSLVFAGELHAQTCGKGGSCLEPGASPGCEDVACCTTVCGLDPTCCSQGWDASCVALANELCLGLCGAAVNGPCGIPNGTPACNDADCCETVCTVDSFCCESAWDDTCALLADFNCETGGPGTCGDPDAGPCDTPHPTGACEDEACCESVCAIDPTCCSSAWDTVCATLATTFCIDGCTIECPPDDAVEKEPCGERRNDPCLSPTKGAVVEPLSVGEGLCGRLDAEDEFGLDADVFEIEIPDLGAPETRVELEFTAATAAFAALVPATPTACGNLGAASVVAESDLCAPAVASACLTPGVWRIVVAAGSPEAIGGSSGCESGTYRLLVEAIDACEDACATATEPCNVAHGDPGCADAACCEAVCAIDPICCTSGWDGLCVDTADGVCGLEAPDNDLCENAADIAIGTTPFSNRLATTDGAELPESCDEGFGLSFEADVWFRHVAECEGLLRVQTCGFDAFDTRIAVYSGGCVDGEVIACNDQAPLCTPAGASRLLAPVVCGETYLIRVGGFKGDTGDATLTLDCFDGPCPPPCPADLDGDGSVGGADLATLLADWGDGPGSGGPSDLDGDGVVGGADLAVLLASWGPCP